MNKLLISLVLAGTCACATAQHAHGDDAPLYEGVWAVKLEGSRTARFVLRDWNGTWQESGATKVLKPACRAKKYPVTVQESTPGEFEFTVWRSATSPSCPDTSFQMKPVSEKLLEGSSSADPKVSMRRLAP